ncbi:molybdate ABC transporter substrate-binding protein [Lyngbya confervoides]|uniref:Molybdate ABC transporter substrate-binding protein n=1 Tax=Lyngbya confervoides BDU141951 TaxID=1574623 RepID=A0ABD4T103_9CYAN|nr:molybdate ABC transporter substrate-binding protein [Lyngbya confervoides]MCM1982382.1 molybdate ABC transporter substrate-binding protein [Lyngbya confervoides BDU141951]
MFRLWLFLAGLLLVWGCQHPQTDALTIATAANMQFAMADLTQAFTQTAGINCKTILGSSGKLTAQIQSGAPFDLFVSADLNSPQVLDRDGFTLAPPQVYAYGKLVLWTTVPNLQPSLVALTEDRVRRIAIANPRTAPYGAAALAVLNHHKIYDGVKQKLVRGESIAQVNQFIQSQAADMGFTAKAVVLSSQLQGQGQWVDLDPQSYEAIAQAVVVLKAAASTGSGDRSLEAQKFVEFLFSDSGQTILRRYGYQPGP